MKAKSDFKKEEDVNVLISKVDEVVGSQLENLLGGKSEDATPCVCNCWIGNSNDKATLEEAE